MNLVNYKDKSSNCKWLQSSRVGENSSAAEVSKKKTYSGHGDP